jgi:CRP-like cAMP-binding protein
MPEFTSSTRNRLLQGLGQQDAAALQSVLQHTQLDYGKLLYEGGQPIDFVYFPLTGVVSMVKSMADGDAAEVGTVGHEGVVGLPVLVGEAPSGTSAHVQIPGEGLRMPARAFRDAVSRSAPLQTLIQRYAFSLFNHVTQLAACNRFTTSNSVPRAGC